MSGWKLIAIAGGGVLVVGGGYMAYKYLFAVPDTKPAPEPEKKKGILEKAFGWLLGEKATEKVGGWLGGVGDFFSSLLHSGSNFVDSTSALPGTILTLIKWVSIVGIILIAILVIVFCYRMAIGSTPDVAGGVSQIMSSVPTRPI